MDVVLAHRDFWFQSRIGRKVFRNNTFCCENCDRVYREGLIISDEMHADYLMEMEAQYCYEGIPLKYFDTRWEALEFEKLPENKIILDNYRDEKPERDKKYNSIRKSFA